MKTVVSSDMVAHLWANQSQATACNSGESFWFESQVIYSYRTPIAMLHETRAGRVALVTSERYSVTTSSRHMPLVSRAIHSAAQFSVPYVGAEGGMAPSQPEAWHAANVKHLADEYRSLAALLLRAHSVYHTSEDSIADALRYAAACVTSYCDAFRIRKAERPMLDAADDARVIWAKRQAREARASTPEAIAKRERAKERREQRAREIEAREIEAREAREAREHFERETEIRARFRAGSNVFTLDERGGALLRVDSDGMVRTSLGEECPHDDARRAFPLIARIRAAGTTWKPEGLSSVKLGSFALHEIRADGAIRAGCHTIHWSEIEAVAKALGLYE